MNTKIIVAASIVVCTLSLSLGYMFYFSHAQGGGMMGRMMSGMMGSMMDGMGRHRYFMNNGLPEQYSNLVAPANSTPEDIEQGKNLYDLNCASCHGENARGDGVVANTLKPRPADLVAAVDMSMVDDAFLFWSISEGGVPVKSGMPPFKNILKEKERWLIINYLKQLQ